MSNFKCNSFEELILWKGSLGRLNVAVVQSSDVRTEAQRWLIILRLRSDGSYTC